MAKSVSPRIPEDSDGVLGEPVEALSSTTKAKQEQRSAPPTLSISTHYRVPGMMAALADKRTCCVP